MTNLNELFTQRSLQKDQFRSPRRAVPRDLLQTEDLGIKINGAREIFNTIAGVEQTGDHNFIVRTRWAVSKIAFGRRGA
jgi:hypothetical protein